MPVKHIFMQLTRNATIIVAHLQQKEFFGGLPVIYSLAEINITTSYQQNQHESQLSFPVLRVRNW
jgi:hypothetical protein